MFFRTYQRFIAGFPSKRYRAHSVSMNKSRKFAAFIIITVILTAFSGIASAQEEEEDGEHGLYIEHPKVFFGGVVAGANFSQVDGDYYAGYRKVGLNIGGIVYTQFAKHAAVSLEILYSQKGSTSNGEQPSPAKVAVQVLQYHINANYAEIPIMINYFDKRRSHAGIGFSYGRLVNADEMLHVVRTDSNNAYRNVDLRKYPFKKDAFDFLAGAELHLWKGLFLNVRFQYSLLPIRTELPPAEYARSKQFSNMWVMRLMYLIK